MNNNEFIYEVYKESAEIALEVVYQLLINQKPELALEKVLEYKHRKYSQQNVDHAIESYKEHLNKKSYENL